MITLKKINPTYRKLIIVVGFMVVFKILLTLFYDSYYYYFDKIAPKWDELVHHKFGLDLYFLKLKPYLEPSFFISSFKSPTTYLGVLVFVYLFIHRKKLTWEKLGVDWPLKLFFILPGILLCWELLTYDFNYYLNHYFLLERVLMLVFLVLVWKHPMYSVWFLMIALLFRAQFDYPIGAFPLFDKKILFDIYLLLISFLCLRTRLLFSKKWLAYFLLILIASSYFTTGLAKLLISPHGYEWTFQNQLGYLVINGQERGWTVLDFWIELISNHKIFFQFLVIFLELLTLMILYKRKWAITVLSFCTLLHLVILYLGGVFFWKWIAMDVLMIVYLLYDKTAKQMFTFSFFKLSLVTIPFAILWANAYPVAWFDTKFNQTFEYAVVLKNGKEYNASKDLFNPYHQLFYRGKFLYLVNQNEIKITEFGYTFDYPLAEALNKSNRDSLESIRQTYGVNSYNKALDEKHTEFIKTFFQNYNNHLNDNYWRTRLKSPKHIYDKTNPPIYNNQGEIKKVKVYLKETYIENGKLDVLGKKLIKSIIVPN